MNQQNYNHQDIRAYLLGLLPEAEAERFDELSFTDEEFSDALKSVEKDLIDAYVQGELAGATLEAFESHYLASPLRREKAAFAEAFQNFAKKNISETTENSVSVELKPERKTGVFFSSMNIFKNQNPIWQWGFATVLLFIAAGGLWIFVNQFNQPGTELAKQNTPGSQAGKSSEQIESAAVTNSNQAISQANKENNAASQNSKIEQTNKIPVVEPTRPPKRENPPADLKPVIASFTLTPSLRGGTRIQSLSVSKETTGVQIKLQLEPNDFTAYKVVLINSSNDANLWRSGVLKTRSKGENKILNINFPAKLLKSQIYNLQVSGISADGTIEIFSDYFFKVVR